MKGPRFYFLVTLLFLSLIVYIFKEPLTVTVKEITFDRVEFREVRDLKGLEIAFENLYDATKYNAYTVYIYQPKNKSFYKRIILTNSDVVKAVSRLQGSYLEEQPSINEALVTSSYVVLDYKNPNKDTQYLHDLGFTYLLIYKLQINQRIIGEIHVSFINKPTQQDITELLLKLGPLLHMYII